MEDTFRKYKFDKNLKAKYGKYIVKKFKKKYEKYSFGANRTQAIGEE